MDRDVLIIFDRKIHKFKETKSNYQEVQTLIQSHGLSKNESKHIFTRLESKTQLLVEPDDISYIWKLRNRVDKTYR